MIEKIPIFKVGTEAEVQTINDLRNNIKLLKQALGDLNVDSQEYKDTLDELRVNQNALQDAMHATTATMDEVAASATGASESYNSLVHRMAALKEEFRSTNDEARRADLGNQIREINDQLKSMDALQGNFQRNVGNYAGGIKDAFKDMSQDIDAFGKSMGKLGGPLNTVKNGFDAFSKSPTIATIGFIVMIVAKIADELKKNETAMNAVKKALAALQPVMDFLGQIIETLAEWLADIILKVTDFITSNGLMDKIIKGVMGVGNAILQYVLTPFRAVMEAIKIFKEQGIAGLGDAAKAFGQEVKNGFSFKKNFETGQQVAETLIAGAASKKKKAKSTGSAIGKEVSDGMMEAINASLDEIEKEFQDELDRMEKLAEEEQKRAKDREEARLESLDKATAHRLELNEILEQDERKKAETAYAIQEEANRKRLSILDQFRQDALDRGDLETYLAYEQERADLEVEIETNAIREKERLRKQDVDDAKKKADAQKQLLMGVANATSSILGQIADAYESNGDASEKNAERVKGLRIAAATIDTISGAIGAYMQTAASLPAPYGIILGAIQAAIVTATGVAQIAKIKSTKTSGNSSPSAPSAPSVVSAPSIPTNLPNVRSVTSASEEERLNRMASDQRVYILSSDIEASQNQVKTQVAESSF